MVPVLWHGESICTTVLSSLPEGLRRLSTAREASDSFSTLAVFFSTLSYPGTGKALAKVFGAAPSRVPTEGRRVPGKSKLLNPWEKSRQQPGAVPGLRKCSRTTAPTAGASVREGGLLPGRNGVRHSLCCEIRRGSCAALLRRIVTAPIPRYPGSRRQGTSKGKLLFFEKSSTSISAVSYRSGANI